MTPEKLLQVNLLNEKISKVKDTLGRIRAKTRPDPRAKVIHPWNIVDRDDIHSTNLAFTGGESAKTEILTIQIPHRLATNWVRDLENYYDSELRILETEFERL